MKKLIPILIFLFIIVDAKSIDSLRVLRETFFFDVSSEDSAKSIQKLSKDIDRVLANKYLNSAKVGVAVYSLESGKYLYTKNINTPLTPASTTKLITTFTLLNNLRKNGYIPTEVYTDSDPASFKKGIIDKNLYIIGYGDGLLSDLDIEALADSLSSLGIREVHGNIYADGSHFDSDNDRFSYSKDNDEVVALPPITGLSINKNLATVIVSSGTIAGKPVNVQIIPNSGAFNKNISAKVRGYSKGYLMPEVELETENYGDETFVLNSEERRSLSISSNVDSETGKQYFNIRGYLYPNRTKSYRYHIEVPELTVAGTLKEKLMNLGIPVLGEIYTRDKVLQDLQDSLFFLTDFKRDLQEIIQFTNKDSDNFLAEILFKKIGAISGVDNSTAEFSKYSIATLMEDYEVDFDGCKVNDGSGLSRRNLIKAATLIDILVLADELNLTEFENSFAIAGVDGTLKKRMKKSPADGNLRGKTGTLRNVSALAGYVNTLDGEKLAFAFLFNGNSVYSYKQIENELGILLSRFFYFNSN